MSVQLEDNWHSSEIVNRVMTAATANIKKNSIRQYSYSAFYSLATEQDNEIEDELAQGMYIYKKKKGVFLNTMKKGFIFNIFIFSSAKNITWFEIKYFVTVEK